jgi:hypothetical protein
MPPPEPKPSDTPITMAAVKSWLPAIVTAGGLLIAGITAWSGLSNRVAALEVGAAASGLLSKRLTRIERLLAGVICTQSPHDPDRCRDAMASVGEE